MSKAEKRLQKELEKLQKDPVPGCTAKLRDEKSKNYYEWEAYIEGPKESPYENGIFRLHLAFPKNYPIKPPQVTFKTRIYHCNISDAGSVCLDILKNNWSPVLTVSKILLSIISLLTDPNPDDPLVSTVASIYKSNRKEHDKTAKEFTQKYAK